MAPAGLRAGPGGLLPPHPVRRSLRPDRARPQRCQHQPCKRRATGMHYAQSDAPEIHGVAGIAQWLCGPCAAESAIYQLRSGGGTRGGGTGSQPQQQGPGRRFNTWLQLACEECQAGWGSTGGRPPITPARRDGSGRDPNQTPDVGRPAELGAHEVPLALAPFGMYADQVRMSARPTRITTCQPCRSRVKKPNRKQEGRRRGQTHARSRRKRGRGWMEWGSNGSYPLSHSGSPDRPTSGAPPAPDHGGGVLRDPFGGPWACQGRKGTYPPTAHTGRSRGAPGGSAPGTRRSPTCDRPPGRPPRRGRPPDTTSGNLRSPRSTLEDC